jgi:2-oxo-4-hydroxy-4-carboxy--5-ureidoimidazoline (OHCU) decarboxylase
MVSAAYKNRTRDEIIAAFRESLRKKREWQERAEEEIKKIREERLQFTI